MTYYLLCERDDRASDWRPEFGDTDKECVVFEAECNRNHGVLKYNQRIETFPRIPKQEDITLRLVRLNAR